MNQKKNSTTFNNHQYDLKVTADNIDVNQLPEWNQYIDGIAKILDHYQNNYLLDLKQIKNSINQLQNQKQHFDNQNQKQASKLKYKMFLFNSQKAKSELLKKILTNLNKCRDYDDKLQRLVDQSCIQYDKYQQQVRRYQSLADGKKLLGYLSQLEENSNDQQEFELLTFNEVNSNQMGNNKSLGINNLDFNFEALQNQI